MKELHITDTEWNEIEQYLDNELNEENRRIFQSKIDNDTLLLDKVTEVKLTRLAIAEVALKEKLNDFHVDNSSVKIPFQPKKKSLSRRWYAAAVIALIITLTSIFFFKDSLEEKLYATYYQPDPGLPTMMSASGNSNFDQAMAAYKAGDYQKSISLWQQQLQSHSQNDTLLYFLGNAYLSNGNANTAIDYFSMVADVDNSAFSKEAEWYLGLIYLKQNNIQKAIEHLRKTDKEQKDELIQQISQ